jgi:Domain of unknown function (DUF6457)
MPDWLETSRKSLAEAVGADASDYELGPGEIERLLELARVAAHESGDRTNAPLVSYLVGLARGRNPERTLDELVAAARGIVSD